MNLTTALYPAVFLHEKRAAYDDLVAGMGAANDAYDERMQNATWDVARASAAPTFGMMAGLPTGASLGALLANVFTKKEENKKRNMILAALGGGVLGAGAGLAGGGMHFDRSMDNFDRVTDDSLAQYTNDLDRLSQQ